MTIANITSILSPSMHNLTSYDLLFLNILTDIFSYRWTDLLFTFVHFMRFFFSPYNDVTRDTCKVELAKMHKICLCYKVQSRLNCAFLITEIDKKG